MSQIENPVLVISADIQKAFKEAIKSVKRTPDSALRVIFRKANGEMRTMDVAYDADISNAFLGSRSQATSARAATNEARNNVVVRERIGERGNYSFQWRTIPVSRILSISPCI